MTDDQLLELLQSDPQQGLEAVVKRYSAYVLKIATTKLRDVCTKEDIEEAVSDIFLLVFKSGQKCGFKMKSLRAYISVIASRHCINVFNKHIKKSKIIPLDEIAETAASEDKVFEDNGLAEALHSLGEPDEFIFVRKYFFGQTSKEIASELNMKPNTIDKRISRGLIKLRKLLEEEM